MGWCARHNFFVASSKFESAVFNGDRHGGDHVLPHFEQASRLALFIFAAIGKHDVAPIEISWLQTRQLGQTQWEDRMRSLSAVSILAAVVANAMPTTDANAQDFHAKFSGFNEVGGVGAGQTGAIFSGGQATLKLKLNTKLQTLNWTLSYSGLSANVTQAHIHFGKRHVGGGIMVFFCSNLANPPPMTQACPATGGTVSGMFVASNVVGPTAQGIAPGDFNALANAILSKTAYGNIHTVNFQAGEIRGEIIRDDDENSQDD